MYTYRRCPYAIRARMVLRYSDIDVEYRNIVFRNKPVHMLEISPKGTVPVLQLVDRSVIDESLDIMLWALTQSDPEGWMCDNLSLIQDNDFEFKGSLDHYKYADRYPDNSREVYRAQCLPFLQQLNARLGTHTFLMGDRCCIVDVAIFPFVRQFAFVDKSWFDEQPLGGLQRWLDYWLTSELFLCIMT